MLASRKRPARHNEEARRLGYHPSQLRSLLIIVTVWSEQDLDRILARGVVIIERLGTDESDALAALERWKQNIYLVRQLIPNEISSTRVR